MKFRSAQECNRFMVYIQNAAITNLSTYNAICNKMSRIWNCDDKIWNVLRLTETLFPVNITDIKAQTY